MAPSSVASASSDIACGRCGTFVPYVSATYSDEGKLLCSDCHARADIGESSKRVAAGLSRAAYSSLIATFISFFFNPLFIVTVVALTTSIGAVVGISRSEEDRRLMGGHLVPSILACAVTLLFTGLYVLLMMFGLLIFAAS